AEKRLPTEAEWEYAARGGFTGLNGKPKYKYPWGDAIDPSKANYYVEAWTAGLRRGGAYPPNNYGLYDMAGNVWEWCADWYDSGYYKQFADSSVVNNPVGPEEGDYRVLRGGSWGNGPNDLRCAGRGRYIPDVRNLIIGFRCVQDVTL
ncbi:MAG: formylglycine-generating enzyme family protein, partial [bacterium]